MNRVWLGILLLLGSLCGASAQQLLPIVVSSCGTPPTTYTAGRSYQPTMDTTGTLCAAASGAATSANQPTNAAQGSTTAGQTGYLFNCATTTGAPTYVTGQTNPCSTDTAGNIRVNVESGGVTTGSAGVPATQVVTVQGISGGTSIPVTGTFGGTVSNDIIITPSANFSRQANTTTYSAGQSLSNSSTGASVVPLSWTAARVNAGNFYVRRAEMLSSGKSVAAAASFILHLYTVTPGAIAGDADLATWNTPLANLVCDIPISLTEAGSDNSVGWGTPSVGNECNIVAAGGTMTIYGILSTTAAYIPTSGETEIIILEIHQN